MRQTKSKREKTGILETIFFFRDERLFRALSSPRFTMVLISQVETAHCCAVPPKNRT